MLLPRHSRRRPGLALPAPGLLAGCLGIVLCLFAAHARGQDGPDPAAPTEPEEAEPAAAEVAPETEQEATPPTAAAGEVAPTPAAKPQAGASTPAAGSVDSAPTLAPQPSPGPTPTPATAPPPVVAAPAPSPAPVPATATATETATTTATTPAAAPPANPAGDAASDDLLGLETIVVVGRAPASVRPLYRGLLAGSRDVTTRVELQDEHPTDTYELFSKTPGVALSRFGQGIINTDVAIRGFAGDGVSPHAKLLIDGIPSHLHNGYGELDQLSPLGIGSIDVFKGTSDARQGRFNTAGNYYIRTRTDEATEFQAAYGSFDTVEVQGYTGERFGRLVQNIFAGYRQTDGFRERSDIQKYNASGRWAIDVNNKGTLALIARVSGYEGDSPGYLTAEQARADRRTSASFANQDGGEKDIQHVGLHYDQWLGGDSFRLSAKAYVQAFERQRWVRFSEAGSLSERFDDQDQLGLITTLSWLPTEDWNVTLGFDVQHEDIIEQRFGTVGQTRIRDTENVIRDLDYDLQTYGGFVTAENSLFERVRWSLGLRADAFGGDFSSTDAEGNTMSADAVDFGLILQPKANVTVDVIEGLIAFANYGRTFQSFFGSSLYAVPGASRSPEVSVNDGWEAGTRYATDFGLDVRVSYWQQLASNEFVSVDGVDRNVGETDRMGFETALRWTPIEPLLLWGNFSWTRTEIVDAGDAGADTVGNRLRSIPDFTTSFGARYDLPMNFFVAAHVDGQGSYYVNEMNVGGTFGDYLLANAQAGWANANHRLQLQGNNLFDSYYEYVFDFSADGTATIHAPGNGINVNLSYTRLF